MSDTLFIAAFITKVVLITWWTHYIFPFYLLTLCENEETPYYIVVLRPAGFFLGIGSGGIICVRFYNL